MTEQTYSALMDQVEERKKELRMTLQGIGEITGESKIGVHKKIKSNNIGLKSFIRIAEALKLQVLLVKIKDFH